MRLLPRSGIYCIIRGIRTCMRSDAKASLVKTAIIPEPVAERDTEKLQKLCCGLNYKKDGADPELKSYNDYPDWLLSVHVGPPKTFKDVNPDTREYWYLVEKAQKAHNEQIVGEKKFFEPCREYEMHFHSRIGTKKA